MPYANLSRIADPATRDAIKILYDLVSTLQRQVQAIGTVSVPLTANLDADGNRLRRIADPEHPLDAVNYRTMIQAIKTEIAAIPPPPP